jgi:quercetin dioxygenase-like cupin family protein
MSGVTIVAGGRQGAPSELRTGTFTGEVWGDPVLPTTDRMLVNTVHFAPGGRTDWHTHGIGQVLVVLSGEGLVFDRAGNGGRIRTGDVVHIPGATEHWHGATADSFMTHLAISVDGHDWLEPVTAEEYERAHRA